MNNPILSIVTVTFRDLPGLRRTLNSLEQLAAEAHDSVEVLVQDGGTDGIDDLLADFGAWVKVQSTPDTGIYDGMNKAVARSRGDFLWFLNGGDEAATNWADLRNLLSTSSGNLILCDYQLDLGPRRIERKSRPKSYIWHGLPTSHQAIFYPGKPVKDLGGYDLTYRVAGDYALTASVIRMGIPVKLGRLPVAVFGAGGMSQQNSKEIASEAHRVQREILGSKPGRILASSILHKVSRIRRDLATRNT